MRDTLHGYTIDRARDAFGNHHPRVKGWTLTDADDAYLMIGRHGCIAPTYRAAVVERDARIEQDR